MPFINRHNLHVKAEIFLSYKIYINRSLYYISLFIL